MASSIRYGLETCEGNTEKGSRLPWVADGLAKGQDSLSTAAFLNIWGHLHPNQGGRDLQLTSSLGDPYAYKKSSTTALESRMREVKRV